VSNEIGPAALRNRLAAGLPTHLVDVREPWELERARLPGSVNIPLGELGARLDELPDDPDTLIVTVCHYGVRSLHAAGLLARDGRRQVRSLAGGIDGWAVAIDPAMTRY
jgi:rhodanese-related sulfurtransferase